MLGFEALLVDLKRINAAAMVFIGPRAELTLRHAVLATRFWNRDLTLEYLEDDRRLPLRGPAFELLGFGLRLSRRG